MARSAVTPGWPLIGRDQELAEILDTLDRSGSVLLAGPAGVGKTRLARSAVDRLPGSATVRWLSGSGSAQSIPLGAFAPVLDTEAAEPSPELLARTQARLAGMRGLVLAVDDAHLLDQVSATLLHQLAAQRAVRLVVTLRTGEPAPDAVTALWKDGLIGRLDIEPFGPVQTVAALEAALGGQVQFDTAIRLHDATAGNVLWLRHLVAGELADGRLAVRDRAWRWSGEPRLTPALTTLIDAAVGPLGNGVRPVVELLALGEPLPVDLLERLSSPAAVDEALIRELAVTTEHAGRWVARLAHPLYGEVVRGRTGELRARRLRGKLATALAETGHGTPDDLMRWGVLALASDLAPDPELLTRAAGRASQYTDHDLALELLARACEYGAGFDAHQALAFGLMYRYRPEEAELAFARAAALAGTDEQRFRIANSRAMSLFFLLDRADDAVAVCREAAALPGGGIETRAMTAMFAAARNDLAAARAAAEPVLAAGNPGSQTVCTAAWAMCIVTALDGRVGRLTEYAGRGQTAALRLPETVPLQSNIAFVEMFGLALAGDHETIRVRTDARLTDSPGLMTTIYRPMYEGLRFWVRGQVDRGARLFAGFRPYAPGSGGGWTAWLEAVLALILGAAGDLDGIRGSLHRADTHRHPNITFVEPLLELARAWLAATEGALSEAVATADRAAGLAAGSGQFAVEVLARHTAVGFGDRTQAGRLAELATSIGSPRAVLAAAHAAALAAADPEALLGVSARFEERGLVLAAAECAAQAADLFGRRGDAVRAGRAGAQAAALNRDCGARSPALESARQPFPLSGRQREVALLAARLTNKQIAERLGVSVRTVEGHVYHACVRLGLANRGELAGYVAHLDPE